MEKTDNNYDLIVIGGGASGMMAAGRAAERGKRVLLLERNKELGKKLSITGGGRCNITNAEMDTRKLLGNFGDSTKFLHSAFSQFGVTNTFGFFEARGVPLVIQARKRAFPETEKAKDVTGALVDFIKKKNVEIKTKTKVRELIMEDGKIIGVRTKKEDFYGKHLIIATGSYARIENDTADDGFDWLRDLGHSVKMPSPNIVPLEVDDEWVHALSGTSLSFMKISFFLEGKRAFSKTGKILFTHFGLSGPLILNSSQEVAGLLEGGMVTATIDCFPDTDLGALDRDIVNIFNKNKNKQFKTVFAEIAPKGTSEALLTLLDINPEKRVHSITVDERKEITHLLKALPMTIASLMGFDRAVIADGGVDLREVDTKTFASKLHDNLFLTGDVLHINRPSGGYSLQLCWTTGFVAGSSIE